MGLIIGLILFLLLLSLGLVVGGMTEQSHFRSLDEREARLDSVLVTQLRSYPKCVSGSIPPQLLVSEVVISSDYLKSFLAGLRNIFGGEVRSFQTLLQRARREAIVRMKEEAISLGYNAICNVRLETADVGGRGAHQKNKIIMASILASATAYHASDSNRA